MKVEFDLEEGTIVFLVILAVVVFLIVHFFR